MHTFHLPGFKLNAFYMALMLALPATAAQAESDQVVCSDHSRPFCQPQGNVSCANTGETTNRCTFKTPVATVTYTPPANAAGSPTVHADRGIACEDHFDVDAYGGKVYTNTVCTNQH